MPLCVCPCVHVSVCLSVSQKYCKTLQVGQLRHSKTNSQQVHIGTFLSCYKSRWFFPALFQLLPIIDFLAPPLLKSHMVVTVSNCSQQLKYVKIQAYEVSIWQRVLNKEAQVSIHEYTLVGSGIGINSWAQRKTWRYSDHKFIYVRFNHDCRV